MVVSGRTDGAQMLAPDNLFHTARIDTCRRPRRPRGIAAYTLDGARLPFTVAAGHEPGTRPPCPPGDLRILRLQTLTIGGQPSYVRRGGCQEPCLVRQPTVHLLARDLIGAVAPLPGAALAGDGAPAAGCTRTVADTPAAAGPGLGRMYYKTPAELRSTSRRGGAIGAGARWSNYGDPGRRFRSPTGRHADYNYLLWNLPRRRTGALLPGGGIVEAVIGQGRNVSLCAAPPLTLPSFDVRGAGNGTVTFGYARVDGTPPIFGWLLLGYRVGGGAFHRTTAGPVSP